MFIQWPSQHIYTSDVCQRTTQITRGNPMPPLNELPFLISSKDLLVAPPHSQNIHTTTFVTLNVESV